VSYDRKDASYRRAKAAGYRARSAYKLIQLDDRFRLLRRGDVVVDLGAWPGAWLQVAAERVGPRGRVVGIDLVAVAPLASPRVACLVGDVRDAAAIGALREELGAPASVVLCDLAPKLSGVRATDDARASELVAAALDASAILLRPGGRMLVKLFMSADYAAHVARLRVLFTDVRTTRPEASRRGTSELYAVCLGYKPPVDKVWTCEHRRRLAGGSTRATDRQGA
jgi:23S rRNA (uridine2552-2'-O)-methyltransferase